MSHHRTWVLAMSAIVLVASQKSSLSYQRLEIPAGQPFVVDVRDFGAKADGRTDCAPAFQKAIDSLAARLATQTNHQNSINGTVLVPAAANCYRLGRTVWVDHPGIEIRGEGGGSRVEAFPATCHPLFLLGLRRKGILHVDGKDVPLIVDRRYRIDLFGRLDLSAAPTANSRWGYRSRGDTCIQAQATPLSDGARSSRMDYSTDHWTEAEVVTMEVSLETAGDVLPKSLQLFGLGLADNARPMPFLVHTGGNDNEVIVQFATQAQPFGPAVTRILGFRIPKAKGVRRITIQLDLKHAKYSAYANGTQVEISQRGGPELSPGLRLAENDYYPFLIGDKGGTRPMLGAKNEVDWVLYGLLLSRSMRYADDGVGRPQRRLAGGTAKLDDRYRYFTPAEDDPGQIGHFAFTDDPDTSGRFLTIQGGPAASNHKAAAFIHHSLGAQQGGILNNTIRDLHLVGGKIYGQNIAVAQVLELKLSGIRSEDAYHAIGSLNHGANYIVRLEDCTLSGTDSGYYGYDQVLWARNVIFSQAGRSTMRFVGSHVRFENGMVTFWTAGNQSTVKMHAGDYGGQYSFDNLFVDYEGPVYSHAPFYCETHPYNPATVLRLRDISLGSIGDTIPLIILRDVVPRNDNAMLFVDGLQSFTKKVSAVVDVDSPVWSGEIRGLAVGDGDRIRYRGKEGTKSRISVRQ